MINQKRPDSIHTKQVERKENNRNQSNDRGVLYFIGRRPRNPTHLATSIAEKLSRSLKEAARMHARFFAIASRNGRLLGRTTDLVIVLAHRLAFFQTTFVAGVPGFEPGLSVLETDVLTVDTIPLPRGDKLQVTGNKKESVTCHPSPVTYFVSLWSVCLRQRRQNLRNSRRSVVVFLFLVVT